MPSSLPTFGVAIPVWNGAATLEWTLVSLRAQAEVSPRILAADSGSTDGTLAILQRWGVSVAYEPPGNMYRAVNLAMRQLDAEWLTWVNSDDLLFPDALSRLGRLGEESSADIVFGQCDYIDYAGRFLFTAVASSVPQLGPLLRAGYMPFCQPAAIFRKRTYAALGGLSEAYRNISDLDFFRRAHAAGCRFARLPGPAVAAFRSHPQQLTQRMASTIREELAQMLAREPPCQAAWRGRRALYQWRADKVKAQLVRRLRASFVEDPLPHY